MLGPGEQVPAGRVRRDGRGLGRGAAGDGEQLTGTIEPGAERAVVPAGAGQRGQFGLGAQSLGAQLDADLRRLLRLGLGEAVVDGPGGVGPAALPEGELRAVAVVHPEPAVLAQGSERGVEVLPRGVEVTPADLHVGADDEGHVRIAGGEDAQGSHAGPFGFIPVADREQRLDPVGGEHRIVDAVTADGLEPRLPQPGRLPRPSQHGQHVGEGDVHPLQGHRIADFPGEPHGLPEPGEALVAAAEVGEVAAEHGERPQLGRPCLRRSRELQRLLADRE